VNIVLALMSSRLKRCIPEHGTLPLAVVRDLTDEPAIKSGVTTVIVNNVAQKRPWLLLFAGTFEFLLSGICNAGFQIVFEGLESVLST
jgi:hypothetical protein